MQYSGLAAKPWLQKRALLCLKDAESAPVACWHGVWCEYGSTCGMPQTAAMVPHWQWQGNRRTQMRHSHEVTDWQLLPHASMLGLDTRCHRWSHLQFEHGGAL
jgi:hypothetical protein